MIIPEIMKNIFYLIKAIHFDEHTLNKDITFRMNRFKCTI